MKGFLPEIRGALTLFLFPVFVVLLFYYKINKIKYKKLNELGVHRIPYFDASKANSMTILKWHNLCKVTAYKSKKIH